MNIDSRLRRAGAIVAAGLLIELLSLLPLHPLAFIAFVGLSVPVIGVGILYFLISLVSRSETTRDAGKSGS